MTSKSGSEKERELETTTEAAEAVAEAVDEDEDEGDDEDEKKAKKEKKEKKKDKKKDKSEKADKLEIAYEAAMPRDEAVSYFEALVGGLRSGHLEFRQDERVLVLAPPDHLEIEVSARQKGDKCKVVFEIEWSGAQKRPLAIVTEATAKVEEAENDD